MVTLLYHWNFTGDNTLQVNDVISDSESTLKAVFKSRGTITSSSFSRENDGIILNNNDYVIENGVINFNGGYYIDLEGLNTAEFGGNLSIEMAVQNHKRDIKAVYFLSVGEESGTNQAFINARFNGNDGKNKMFFGVRTDSTTDVNYTERKIDEDNNTVIDDSDEHHYIFSFNYDSSGSSVKFYIDGDKKGENTADLEKGLTTTARSTNFIGTRKVEGTGVTYLNGVVKYLKIYQNSISNSEAESIYNNYNTSPYLSNISNGTNGDKFTRRHDDVGSYFTNNPSISSFAILGNQLGLKNNNIEYKIYKFTSGSTINIGDNFNYIPISGKDNFIILKYNSIYFRVTQTSVLSNENAKYKCEISLNNTDNFTEVCTNKGFGDNYTYTNNNINFEIVFGGAEFLVSNNNEICFHEDTLIDTDQGKIKIKNLKSFHTINNSNVLYLIKSDTKYQELVLIKQNAFDFNKPNTDIILTKSHLININNEIIPVHKLINNDTVIKIRNNNSSVYNMILLNKNFINIGNLKLNVIGISEKSNQLLDISKEKGIESLDLKFSKNTIINLKLCNFKNF